MKLDKNFDSFNDDFYDNIDDGQSRKPPCKGYEMVILNAKDTKSKAGNPMLVLTLNIAKGDYKGFFEKNPLKMYLPYHTDSFKGRLTRVLKTIINDNPGVFSANVLDNNEFDESKLQGLLCGGVLKYNDKGYLDIHYITSIEKALQKKVIEKPQPNDNSVSVDSLF